jgi:hypothetical protein
VVSTSLQAASERFCEARVQSLLLRKDSQGAGGGSRHSRKSTPALSVIHLGPSVPPRAAVDENRTTQNNQPPRRMTSRSTARGLGAALSRAYPEAPRHRGGGARWAQAVTWDQLAALASFGQFVVVTAAAIFAYLRLRGLRRQQEGQIVQHTFDELNQPQQIRRGARRRVQSPAGEAGRSGLLPGDP